MGGLVPARQAPAVGLRVEGTPLHLKRLLLLQNAQPAPAVTARLNVALQNYSLPRKQQHTRSLSSLLTLCPFSTPALNLLPHLTHTPYQSVNYTGTQHLHLHPKRPLPPSLRQLKSARKQLRDFNTAARVQLEGQLAALEAGAGQLLGIRQDLDAVNGYLR